MLTCLSCYSAERSGATAVATAVAADVAAVRAIDGVHELLDHDLPRNAAFSPDGWRLEPFHQANWRACRMRSLAG